MDEVEHVYHAHGGAAELFCAHDPEILMDGPAGTGKTRGVLQRVVDLCETYRGTRALICRATRTSCTESILVTLERDIIHGYPWDGRDVSRAQRDRYDCANGSAIVVGGLDHPERLYSTEWDLVYVAEAIEITEDAWQRFARAMRNKAIPLGESTRGPIQPDEAQAEQDGTPLYWTQRIADTNPGAPGHWLNQRCIAGRMRRILSRHADNPSVTPDFLAGLKSLTGHLRARMYEGRWVSAEGSVYPEFNEARHVVAPFDVPGDWPWYVAIDPGYDHPCAILWFAVAPNGTIFVADELYRGGLSVAQHAADVHARNKGRTVLRYLGDPQHAFSRTAQSPDSIAVQFGRCGIRLGPWPRTAGNEESMVEAVRDKLRKGSLRVFRSCVNTIREFQSWSYKRTASGELPPGEDKFEDRDNHCLSGDTLVHSVDGLVPIGELVGKSGWLHTPYGRGFFFDVHCSGWGNLFRWTFSNGLEIDATREHKIQLADGSWKSLANIQSHDWTHTLPHGRYGYPAGLRRKALLQAGQVFQEAVSLFGDGVRMAQPGFTSRGVDVPPWVDPYGLSRSSHQRESSGQPNREPAIDAGRFAPVFARSKASAPREDEVTGRPHEAFGGRMASKRRGEGLALHARESNREAKAGGRSPVRMRGVWHQGGATLPAKPQVLLGSVQLAGAGSEESGEAARLVGWRRIGFKPVYDLSVDGLHCFIVNGGVVVSNSMDALKGFVAAGLGHKHSVRISG